MLKRNPESYIFCYFIPSSIMVFVSWVSFGISFESVPGRIGLLLTILLMQINMSNSIASDSPKSKQISPLLGWVTISTAFIIVALLQYFFILYQQKFGFKEVTKTKVSMQFQKQSNIRDWANKLDKICLIVLPCLYILSILIFVYIYSTE